MQRNMEEPISENTNGALPVDVRVREYSSSLVLGVLQNRDELDRLIEECTPSWPLDQMSSIDRNILRLAIFEVLLDNRVPLKAAINEAVELGKRFGSDNSSRFINGVLGTVAANEQARGRKLRK